MRGQCRLFVRVSLPVFYRKGIGSIFPNLDTEIGPHGPRAATQTKSETSAGVPGRVLFSL